MEVAAEKDDTRSTSSKATSRASTTASTRLREARIKEELARKRQEQLLKEQELRKKEFELKEEMDKMKAENELENARAEAALWQEAENEQYVLGGNSNLPLSGMPEPDITDIDHRTQAWCNQQAQTPEGGKDNVMNVHANDFIPNTDKVVAGAHKEQAGHDGDKKGPANKVSDLGIANMLAMAMSLPKPDIQPFSGNPVDYWKFMNTFEVNIGDKPKEDKNPEQGELQLGSGKSNEGSSHAVGGRRAVSLRVVPFRVVNGDKDVTTWALLDNGSDVSLCEHGLIHELGVVGRNTSFKLTTVNTASSQKGMEVSLSIQSLNGDVELEMPSLWTIDRLPTSRQSIPVQEDVDKWPHLRGIELPNVAESDIRLLIGSDVPEAFWVEEERRGRRKEPYAIRSPLGWTVMGPTSSRFTSRKGSVNNVTIDSHLQFQLERFWQMDKMPGDEADQPAESTEDRRAKQMMEDSVTLTDGHYQLGLPWRRQPPILQQRQKWTKEEINFKTDDLVLMVDDSLPRGQWPLGRICDTYPDKHGRVRQVEVRIGPNQYKRPISKLCLLEAAK
ncbi:uncharacterized protein LOC121415105 [Lytechinus variegatus]|uniref:uncharacterized protein LOC121415105 n=1 Tax=Lytechinus variegatus TaxID=7654 RepID=UPI001BB297DF|nr:uncharacterized protein LOC121415105 [Lytechinus variegatus]